MAHDWVRGLARSSLNYFFVDFGIESTVLSSAGNTRLRKATPGNVGRPAGSVGIEQATGEPKTENKGVDYDIDS